MSGTIDGSYTSSDRRQINRATIGEGEIIIRLDPSNGLEGLNRDLRRAQELTKDESVSVQVYVDTKALVELLDIVKKGFEDDRTREESIQALSEMISKGLITQKEAEALLLSVAFTSDELTAARDDLSRLGSISDPEVLVAYMNKLSPQERAAIAAVSMEKGRTMQEYELGLMALIGPATYLKVMDVNSPSEFAELKIDSRKLLPPSFWASEQVLLDSAAEYYAANNDLENGMAAYRSAQTQAEKLQALSQIASEIGLAFGINDITLEIVPADSSSLSDAYVKIEHESFDAGLLNFFVGSGMEFNGENKIYIPENSNLLKGDGGGLEQDVVYVFSHEITHLRQISIMNDQISDHGGDVGILLVVGNSMQVAPSEIFGLYRTNPVESHAYAAADYFINKLKSLKMVR